MEFVYDPQQYAPNPGSQYGYYRNVNEDFFGKKSGTNWKDSTSFAYEQIAQREANALNIALMNYQNEYNSPLNTMLRYQQAGISPWDVVNKGTPGAAAPAAAKAPSASASYNQQVANQINTANSLVHGVTDLLEGALGAKSSLIKLKYLDQIESNNAWVSGVNVGIAESKEKNQQLDGMLKALAFLGLASQSGISLKNLPDGQGNLIRDLVLGDYNIPEDQVLGDDTLVMQLAKALYDLRVEQKQTQESQQGLNKANKDFISGAKTRATEVQTSQREITGIPIVDKLLNKFLD